MLKLNGVIQRKFALLDNYLLRLAEMLRDINFDKFKDDWGLQRTTERSLQVMIEVVIDVAERIIAVKNAGPAASSAEALEKLVQLGVLQSAADYKKMIGFRNILVHQYCDVDPKILFDLAKNHLEDFRKFRNEIDKIS